MIMRVDIFYHIGHISDTIYDGYFQRLLDFGDNDPKSQLYTMLYSLI